MPSPREEMIWSTDKLPKALTAKNAFDPGDRSLRAAFKVSQFIFIFKKS
jgi:hypothetical protein